MAKQPRVSILMPCYNAEPFVAEAMQSIIDQTFSDWEFIVVDDGSRDDSAAIITAIASADARVTVIRQPNGGIVSALNAGLSRCRGEYVARMDADDVAFPDRLLHQVRYLDEHPGCVLVGGRAVYDRVVTPTSRRTTGGRHKRTSLSTFPPKVAVAVHPLIMVRRAALTAVGGYRDGFAHAEDYDLYLRLSQLGSIDNPPQDMLFYRRHENAVSARNIEVQEQAAAAAELDALKRAGYREPPPWLLEPYVRFRIWRRYQFDAPDRAAATRHRALADLMALAPRTLLSPAYFRLRLRLLAALVRGGVRR